MVNNKPTTIVQIMSQSDIMRRANSQNYKINRKIWEMVEKKEENINKPTDTEENIESKEVTFTVLLEGEQTNETFLVDIDGVSKTTNENGVVTFNIINGSHVVKIFDTEQISTFYYKTINIDEQSTSYNLSIETKTITFSFIDKNTKELVTNKGYFIEVIDDITDYIHDSRVIFSNNESHIFKIPLIIKLYKGESTLISSIAKEVLLEGEETTITFEVESDWGASEIGGR